MAAATVADIMDRDAPVVRAGAGVEEVVSLFKQTGIGGLPVINEGGRCGGRCIGIITEDDLIIADSDGDLHIPHYIELFGGLIFLESLRSFEQKLKKASAATAQDLMTANPVTVEHDDTPRRAGRLMAESHHSRLPVIEHGRCVGLVTRADVLAALVEE
jgi:CBS domain-containing protein